MPTQQKSRVIEVRNWSLSAIREFERCGFVAYHSRVLRQPPEWTSMDLVLGSVLHEVIAEVIVGHLNGISLDRQKVEGDFAERFVASLNETVRIVREGHTDGDYLNIGIRCVGNLFEDVLPRLYGHRPLCSEEWLNFPVGRYRFAGRLDVATVKDGIVNVHEFKTGSRIPPESDTTEQLCVYILGLRELMPTMVKEQEAVGHSHYIRQGLDIAMEIPQEKLEELLTDLERRIDAIVAANDTTPKPNALCDWCGYRSICPAISEDAA